MPTVTLNPNIVSLLAVIGRSIGFDSGQGEELVSTTLKFVGGGVDADVRNNQAQYIEAARRLLGEGSIADQEALLKGVQRAFSNLNPQEFVVNHNGKSLAFNTARFIEFFHGIHVGFGQIDKLVNESDLLIYPNHEKFGPLLRASVHNPSANTDSILREPGFMQAVFKAFGDIGHASDLVELGGLIANLEFDLDSNKIDWACKQITGELDKQPEAKPEAGEPALRIVGRFKETLSPIVHNIGSERAMAFGHKVAEDIGEIGNNSSGTPTTIASERFRNLVKDFDLDRIISFRERSLIKDLYFLLGGDPECNFEKFILRDDRYAIVMKCLKLNGASSGGISALAWWIDNKTVLDTLNNKLGSETDTKKQAEIVKAFIEGDEIPANLKSYEPVTNLLAKLTEIANGTATAKANPLIKIKQEILAATGDILDDAQRAELSKVMDVLDIDKLQREVPSYSLGSLKNGLVANNNDPLKKASYLGTYLHTWKSSGVIADDENKARAESIMLKVFDLDNLGPEGFKKHVQLLQNKEFSDGVGDLYFHMCRNLASNNVPREDVQAFVDRIKGAKSMKELHTALDELCITYLGEEYTNLGPHERYAVLDKMYPIVHMGLDSIANGLPSKADQAKAKATEGKKGGSWWSNIPIIGFIGSLIASGIGLIWAFKAENKKPPIILTLIGAIGAVITGLINWVFNKGGKEGSQADNQNNQPKTQTARREKTAAPEVA